MRTRIVAFFLLAGLFPAAALASRAELDGRGLPRYLALDPTLIRNLPGSAGRLEPRIDVDLNVNSSDYYIDENGGVVYSSGAGPDDFVLGLGGSYLRLGYLLDGNRHHLILAGPAGWGFILGYERSTYTSTFDLVETAADTLVRSSHRNSRSEFENLRLGAGWQGIAADGRVIELGVGAGLLRRNYEDIRTEVGGRSPSSYDRRWKSGRGFGVDVTLRTVTRGTGPLVALQAAYENSDPEVVGGLRLEIWRLTSTLQAGWRFPVSRLDDFVLGLTSSMTRSFDDIPGTRDSVLVVQRRNSTSLSARLFASGEKTVWKGLLVRGGVQAGASYRRQESEEVYPGYPSGAQFISSRSSSWSFDSPSIYLGAGWRRGALSLDAQIRNSIDLDRPVARWSASVLL